MQKAVECQILEISSNFSLSHRSKQIFPGVCFSSRKHNKPCLVEPCCLSEAHIAPGPLLQCSLTCRLTLDLSHFLLKIILMCQKWCDSRALKEKAGSLPMWTEKSPFLAASTPQPGVPLLALPLIMPFLKFQPFPNHLTHIWDKIFKCIQCL